MIVMAQLTEFAGPLVEAKNLDPSVWIVQVAKRIDSAISRWNQEQTVKVSLELATVMRRAIERKHGYLCVQYYDHKRKNIDPIESTMMMTRDNGRKIDKIVRRMNQWRFEYLNRINNGEHENLNNSILIQENRSDMAKNQGKKAKKEADKAEKAKKEAEKAKKAKEEAEKAKQEELAREEAEKAKQEALNELYWDRGRNVA